MGLLPGLVSNNHEWPGWLGEVFLGRLWQFSGLLKGKFAIFHFYHSFPLMTEKVYKMWLSTSCYFCELMIHDN